MSEMIYEDLQAVQRQVHALAAQVDELCGKHAEPGSSEALLYGLGRALEIAHEQKRVGIALERVGARESAKAALHREEVHTIQAAAARSRESVAALPGVGPRSLARLDAALAVEGLSWNG